MLIQGINDSDEEIEGVANFLAKLKPNIAYLAIPTRPPAVTTVTAASEQVINMVYQIFSRRLDSVEYLIGYEGNAFASTSNARDDLLSITSVHPMGEEAVAEFLKRTGTGWDTVQDLIENHSVVELKYQGEKFYIRKLPALSLPCP
jgi:wyosine [tRNA(Phe)-imidazoG37] synthetase (radical SAM superfamily)